MIDKPKIGEPCNGCGLCCMTQLCNTGAFLLKKVTELGEKTIKGKCPALMSNPDGTFACGLIKNPKHYIRTKYRGEVISRAVAGIVGAGRGCDELPEEYSTPEEEAKLEKYLDDLMSDPNFEKDMIKNVDMLIKIRG